MNNNNQDTFNYNAPVIINYHIKKKSSSNNYYDKGYIYNKEE